MRQSLTRLSKMFLLGERDVRKALDLNQCLEVNKRALISICQGKGFVPSRLGLPYPNHPSVASPKTSDGSSSDPDDWTLIKPAAFYGQEEDSNNISMGLKVVSVRAKNPSNGLPLVPASILLVDPPSGIVQATLSGTYVTVARTSAGPALAVQTFKPDLQHLVLFGAGAQAAMHIELMELAIQRRIPKITIINRSLERAQGLKENLDRGDDSIQVAALDDTAAIASALQEADVVAATTNTTIPLWKEHVQLKEGCLITGIGSYTPGMQEIPEYVVNDSHVVIDTPDAMSVGDLQHLGSYESTKHPVARAGDAFVNPEGIGSSTKYIFYKAVGTAIQDVLTAEAVVKSAKEKGIGQEYDMS
ncbi:unnamed protein product [Cylindrotheca closterium]|uniref:Thiomorpholine-carboxylate dehydrogenase n=1 Tax=Cylindrotheca closterium TaxID=2856 RepID=A0AAD2FBN6_9STRA|nr:unnamed protein product [Cylindrotheca closterium]